jgi:hypothetical protein
MHFPGVLYVLVLEAHPNTIPHPEHVQGEVIIKMPANPVRP